MYSTAMELEDGIHLLLLTALPLLFARVNSLQSVPDIEIGFLARWRTTFMVLSTTEDRRYLFDPRRICRYIRSSEGSSEGSLLDSRMREEI